MGATIDRHTMHDAADHEHVAAASTERDDEVGRALTASVVEGAARMDRSISGLFATGAVGGLDVAVGIMGLLLVMEISGNEALAALAFSFGFIALTLGGSELFTENFLLPVSAVAAGQGSVRKMFRLWAGTAVFNVIGGLALVTVLMLAKPELAAVAVAGAEHYTERGLGLESFLGAVLAGVVITLMTWMQAASEDLGPKIVAAIGAAFLLAYGHLGHTVVASLKIAAGMFGGLELGILDVVSLFGLLALGNVVGGVGLVTVLRIVQAGRESLDEAGRAADHDRATNA